MLQRGGWPRGRARWHCLAARTVAHAPSPPCPPCPCRCGGPDLSPTSSCLLWESPPRASCVKGTCPLVGAATSGAAACQPAGPCSASPFPPPAPLCRCLAHAAPALPALFLAPCRPLPSLAIDTLKAAAAPHLQTTATGPPHHLTAPHCERPRTVKNKQQQLTTRLDVATTPGPRQLCGAC